MFIGRKKELQFLEDKYIAPQLTLEFIKQHVWSAEHEKTK